MPDRGAAEKVTDERLLLELLIGDGPAFFASELEDDLPLSRQQITRRLDDLENSGEVTSKKASGRRLWWLTDSGRERVATKARESLS